MSKIGIIQIDGKLPNLALMKVAAYHAARGDTVERYEGPLFHKQYEKVYASKIFKFSELPELPDDVILGGTGINWDGRLPEDIDETDPAGGWFLYPEYHHHIGFSEVGCRFVCAFCCVPQKDGKPKDAGTIARLLTNPNGENRLNLLDDDFFGQKIWREKCDEILDLKLRVCFSQGLNIRVITKLQAEYLAKIDFWALKFKGKKVTFAWDQFKDGKLVRKGFDRCLDAGISPGHMQFFVLIGFDTTPEQDMERVVTLRDWGARPYVMRFDMNDPYQRRFQNWVNGGPTFWSVDWEDYASKEYKADVRSKKLADNYSAAMWDEDE